MFISAFNLRKDKNKILWYIILGAVTVAVILIAYNFINMTNVSKGKVISEDKKELFNAKDLCAEYEVNIISNKNSNKYYMKEWYLKNNDKEFFKFQTINNDGQNLEYIIADNKLTIRGLNQISEYSLSEYVVNKDNLLSITTFINLYKKIDEIERGEVNNKCCKIEIQQIDDKECYRIIFNELVDDCEICKLYNSILKDGIKISKIELLFDTKNNKPVEYIIYNQSGNVYIDINYKNFQLNTNFDEKLFANLDKWCIIYESRG